MGMKNSETRKLFVIGDAELAVMWHFLIYRISMPFHKLIELIFLENGLIDLLKFLRCIPALFFSCSSQDLPFRVPPSRSNNGMNRQKLLSLSMWWIV